MAVGFVLGAAGTARAALPDHPLITEVYRDPPGLDDGPVLRDPTNLHQSFIEIYLPPSTDLAPALLARKDALRLAFYEIEGDSSSSGNGLVNYRIDLPTFDLDPSNGLTLGAVARPASGAVVLGWVDYVGNPPIALFGTPSTRLGLIDGGIVAPGDYAFVALNGAQFGGTTNFPVPPALSLIHMPTEATSGIIQNGSGVYLLMDRDAVGYVELYDDRDTLHVPPLPPFTNADPKLALGTVLGLGALMDAFGHNNDEDFRVDQQPEVTGTLDNEVNLPGAGVFTPFVPQLPLSIGTERIFVDLLLKTTEDGVPLNEDPAVDAELGPYVPLTTGGPLGRPSPGRVHTTTSDPSFVCGDATVQVFDVLVGTTPRPGVICANDGGDFTVSATATPGAPANPAIATVASAGTDVEALGYSLIHPPFEITLGPAALPGATTTVPIAVSAANVNPCDPPLGTPSANVVATLRVIDPQTGLDAAGLPFQATALAALHGLPPLAGRSNEFSATSVATFVAANLGGLVHDPLGNGVQLLNPATNLGDPFLVDAMELDLPENPLFYINASSPLAPEDLVTTVTSSAEFVTGGGAYDGSFNAAGTLLKAIELPIAETRTLGGAFVPNERVHFADARGRPGDPGKGFADAATTRGFELAIVDTNVQQLGTLETGATDDFGIIVQVGQRRGIAVAPGQFVFLSYSGGQEGQDIDTVDVPPHGNRTVITYLDLDALDSALGVETITRLYVVDGNGTSSVNVIEAFSLNVAAPTGVCGDVDANDIVNAADVDFLRLHLAQPVASPLSPTGAARCNVSGALTPSCDALDVAILTRLLQTPTLAPGVTPTCPGFGV